MPKLKLTSDGKAFKITSVVHDPTVVEETKGRTGPEYDYKVMEGRFYRVIPCNAVEVFLLRGLEKGRQKWAFAAGAGNGVCVSEAVVYGNFA